MTTLVVPPLDAEPWPSLGGQVAEWVETNLVHGPGDLRGQPARLDLEKRALLWRMYEVFPRRHPNAGRRRFRRCAISLRKGSAKTEFAAWIAAAELHPAAPVRCVGWDGDEPIGGGVTDPYIPMVAYTEEQSEELAYGALRVILSLSEVAADFDIGLERILRRRGGGKAVALANAPDARDGARTTFSHADETHRFTLPRLREAHRVMLANLPKRRMADGWMLETTTAPAPGEGSVAEATMDYARQVLAGQLADARLFFFHRAAGDQHKLDSRDAIRAAVLEASGPVADWSDIDGIVDQWDDPTADRAYLERVWLNRLVRASERAFDAQQFRALARPDYEVPAGEVITLGFDGALFHDSTALIGTAVRSGYQWLLGCWEQPPGQTSWSVPERDVDLCVVNAFARWRVWRMYADPYYWQGWTSKWAGQYGDKVVVEWRTNRYVPMAYTLRTYETAIQTGELSHDGSEVLIRHVGNAYRRMLPQRDEEDKPLWLVQKERGDSPHKIDAAMAAVLSWQARIDAIADGALTRQEEWAFGAV